MLDPADAYRLAHDDQVALPAARDVVEIEGPDASSFLHSLLSQNVESMEVDESRWSYLLQPQGKVHSLLRLRKTAPEAFAADLDPGQGSRLVAGLSRFKLRTKVELTLVERVPMLAWRGPNVTTSGLPPLSRHERGVDLLGRADAGEGPAGPPEVFEVLRIEAGVPVVGRDIDESTIPQEAGFIDVTVDFAKGCYLGQELVARIDSRGHVNQLLRGVVGTDLVPGAELRDDEGKARGVVRSVATNPVSLRSVGLAMVRREVEPSSTLDFEGQAVTVAALPIAPPAP